MRTLFVGDLHAKADLLPLISRVAQRENTDRMVLLGDVCDDWNVSNNGLIRFSRRSPHGIGAKPGNVR